MPISTVRAKLKKFKSTGTVTKLHEDPCLFCPHVYQGELQRKVASWGHQVSKTTTSMPNYLEGMPENSFSCHFTKNLSTWSSSMKKNGLRFLSLYSTTFLDVIGEDSVLFYWQRQVVQIIKCKGAKIMARGFVKKITKL